MEKEEAIGRFGLKTGEAKAIYLHRYWANAEEWNPQPIFHRTLIPACYFYSPPKPHFPFKDHLALDQKALVFIISIRTFPIVTGSTNSAS